MVDESEIDTPGGPGPYPSFANDNAVQVLSPTSNAPGPGPRRQQQQQISPQHDPQTHSPSTGQPYPSMTSLLDQNLDWDPFGLSASMAFPSQPYQQVDPSNMR